MPRPSRGQGRLFEKKLFYGDNLRVLRMPEHFAPETVDLVYLDPPFKPNEKYNILFRDHGSSVPSASQVRAFEDTWKWGTAARDALNDVKENAPHHVRETMEALHTILGFSNMFAYLAMMAPRLVELHTVMKPTGSIYLHCDPAAGAYLKVLMDSVFGPENFRSEIVWKRTTAHSDSKQGRKIHGHIHDVIFFYTKSDKWTWNAVYTPYDQSYIDSHYRFIEEGTGRRFRKDNLTAAKPGGDTSYEWNGVKPYKNRYWAYSREKMQAFHDEGRLSYTRTGMPELKRYLDEMPGIPPQDLWSDVDALNARAAERLGYPTQKPLELLERIIATSSAEGDVVLDPFCGCGSTIEAAENLGRNWLGIDITYDAIPIIRGRLSKRGLEDKSDFEVWGMPETVTDAETLAKENPYQFQWWAVGRLGAREGVFKKGADKGVDGRLTLVTDAKDHFPEAVISVKAGQTGPAHVRELAGTMKAQKAEVGVLVVVRPPTKGMREAADAEGGYAGQRGVWCPRLQILTAAQIIAGEGVQAPTAVPAPARRDAVGSAAMPKRSNKTAAKSKVSKRDERVKINMEPEDALRRLLNTPKVRKPAPKK